MDIEFFVEYYSYFLKGTGTTLLISLFGVIFGSLVGILLALMKLSNNKFLKGIATSYIEIVRGTPLILQIFLVYHGLPKLIPLPSSRIFLGTIAVFLNSAAYVAEIIRAGIQSIDKGQMEASRSLGMPQSMAMKYIIIPQAFKNILPALGNEFIVLIKESAIISVIGVQDLMYNADTLRGITYRPFAPLIFAGIIYFIITFSLSKLLGILERRLGASDKSKESL
ncbi:amino acid ABC transporter permease [Tissierella carlieri]|jgi:His/Glu/Gln/Arg/opine family amino acid ABC transporter permease subunit|uniref:amino acid ABC transporter permease n=1 Tax=Tissierella carlieri TaxID=689904 RepID=UPI001C116D93|nr:amino acid ABC transporter permease [Tissierella carlieri]MBU5312788.1 amino acid ABC transporter permease [Tissierella carlieri]